MGKQKYVWMEIDRDGMPIAIADTAKELAIITKSNPSTIRSAVSYQRKRVKKKDTGRPRKWTAVEVNLVT